MDKCLITKLNGNASSELPYFGGAIIKVANSGNGVLNVIGSPAVLKASGEEDITVASDTPISRGDLTFDKDYTFISKFDSFPKASTNTLQGFIFNIEDFAEYKGFSGTEEFQIYLPLSSGVTGNIDNLPSSNAVTSINLLASYITGSLSTIISHYPNIGKNNGVLNTYNTGDRITGEISDLAGLHYSPVDLYIAKNIEGDFYDAIVGWRENIGTTGTMKSIYCGNNAHLWSVYPGSNKLFKISWTSTTSSITVDGVTTTFDNSGNVV